MTKQELKLQRDALKRYNRYLPMLQLKKQQLQAEVSKIDRERKKRIQEKEVLETNLKPWVDVFAQEFDIHNICKLKQINTELNNIAGVDIPVFQDVVFEESQYDYFSTPFWVDEGIEMLKKMIEINAQLLILSQQKTRLQEELRITTQRVNLFEKVKIPQTIENIRVIHIYLGDLEVASVVRGKIAKNKMEQRQELVNV